MGNKDKTLELRVKGLTYQAIGDQLGISRQRVHQLLTGYEAPSLRENKRLCSKRYRQTEAGKQAHRELQAGLRERIKALVLTHYGNDKLACLMILEP